jgi:hypothetical protein
VSLLDTASARGPISQSAVPAMIEGTTAAIGAREKEKAAVVSDSDLGAEEKERIAEIDGEIAGLKEKLAGLEAEWAAEQKLVAEIRSQRDILNPPEEADGKDKPTAAPPSAQGDWLHSPSCGLPRKQRDRSSPSQRGMQRRCRGT